jgi:hypothetical protein
MFAIVVLEKELIVVSGSAAEEMMSCNQAFMFQNLFIFILSSDIFA